MSERFTTARVPYARALGAPPVMGGSYDGAELGRTCLRPGAYDALKLPSRISGREVSREEQRAQLLASLPPAPPKPPSVSPTPAAPSVMALAPTRAPQPTILRDIPAPAAYRPREGRGPHQVLQHLQAHGGHLLYSELGDKFDIPRHSLTAIFKPALEHGALIQLRVGANRARALALPGYVLATQTPAPSIARGIDIDRVHHTRPAAAPPALVPASPSGDPVAMPAVDLRRTLEEAARLLLQAAAALPLSTN